MQTFINYDFILLKGQLRATICKSVETVHLILLCYFGFAIRCAESAESLQILSMIKKCHISMSLERTIASIIRQKQRLFMQLQSTEKIEICFGLPNT